jgi:uracil-DNA glycosylase
MEPSARDELLQLIRDIGAQLAWQRDGGLLELPALGELPIAAESTPVVSAPVVSAPVVSAPVVSAPVVSAPVVSAPVVSAPVVSAPVLPATVSQAPRSEPLPASDRAGALRVIQSEVQACRACKLAPTRTQTVFARGNPSARLCFIGEGPGAEEDRTGLPFVGAAGQLLDRIIAAMRLREEDVYVANIVKCRPPNNRVPDHEEMSACTPFLLRQLEVVKPEIIVALGKTATGFLLESRASMGSMRGRWHTWKGVSVMPTWHPSFVLRVRDDPKSTARAEVWTDMKLVLERLGLPVPSPRG